MTKDEIKAINTVPDVLARYGINTKRGRCKGFCHGGKDFNAKVSRDFYYCYVCGKGMDIFDITMELNQCDFRTAVELLGGTDKHTFTATVLANKAKREREQRIAREKEEQAKFKRLILFIDAYRGILEKEEPLSDLWCYCYNKLQYQLYLLDLHKRKEVRMICATVK